MKNKTQEHETEQELIPFDSNNIVEFDPLKAQLAEMRNSNKKAVFDITTPKGNKEARSHIYTLRQTKAVVEKTRVAAKEKAIEYGRAVDAKAKEIVAEIEGMIEEHAKPLQELEEKEKRRIANHEEAIAKLSSYTNLPYDTPATKWEEVLSQVEDFVVDESLEEFQGKAAIEKDQALTAIKTRLENRRIYEKEQEELKRLREQAEKQKRIDRDREIALKAAEEATRKAEEKADREREEREREEKDRIAAQEKLAQQQQAERDRLIKEAEEANERAANAEREAKEKAEKELADKKAAEEEAERKRQANKKHKAKINSEAENAIDSVLFNAGSNLHQESAKRLLEAIIGGHIPHVTITY